MGWSNCKNVLQNFQSWKSQQWVEARASVAGFVGMAKSSRLTAVQGGRGAPAMQACVPRRKKKTIRVSMHTHYASGLRAPQTWGNVALPYSATNVPVHEMFLHPADVVHVVPHWASSLVRLVSLFRIHERMSCAGIVLRRSAGKDSLALCSAPHAPSEACKIQIPQRLEAVGYQPTTGACSRAAFSSRHRAPACRPASVPVSWTCGAFVANPVWRSCPASRGPCPAPANLAAPVRETVANCCVFARTVAQKSWPTPKTCNCSNSKNMQ